MSRPKPDLSEGQKNRRVREALELLKYLGENFPREEFYPEKVIEERVPLIPLFSDEEMAVIKKAEEDLGILSQYLVTQDSKLVKDHKSSQKKQQNHRGRLTAAFKWLEEHGLIEAGEIGESFVISMEGDEYLESLAR